MYCTKSRCQMADSGSPIPYLVSMLSPCASAVGPRESRGRTTTRWQFDTLLPVRFVPQGKGQGHALGRTGPSTGSVQANCTRVARVGAAALLAGTAQGVRGQAALPSGSPRETHLGYTRWRGAGGSPTAIYHHSSHSVVLYHRTQQLVRCCPWSDAVLKVTSHVDDRRCRETTLKRFQLLRTGRFCCSRPRALVLSAHVGIAFRYR